MEINHDTDDFLTELWSLRERYMDLRNRLVNITPILYINSVDVYGDLYHRDLSKLREDEDRDVKKVLNKYKNSGERSLVPKVGDKVVTVNRGTVPLGNKHKFPPAEFQSYLYIQTPEPL